MIIRVRVAVNWNLKRVAKWANIAIWLIVKCLWTLSTPESLLDWVENVHTNLTNRWSCDSCAIRAWILVQNQVVVKIFTNRTNYCWYTEIARLTVAFTSSCEDAWGAIVAFLSRVVHAMTNLTASYTVDGRAPFTRVLLQINSGLSVGTGRGHL